MAYFLAGCALLVLLLLAGRQFAYANPSKLVGTMRKTAGIAVLAAAGFLLVRGALPLAIPLAVFGLSLMGRGGWFGLGGPFASSSKTPGQKSDVRTDRLEMQLDHDSGQMDGTCFTGRFAGRSALDPERPRGDGAAGRASPRGRAGGGSDGSLSRLAPAGLA